MVKHRQTPTWPEYYREAVETTDAADYLARKRKTRWATLAGVREFTPAGGKVLEAGCGTSALCLVLEQDGFRCTGLDHDPEMIRIAKLLNQKAGGSMSYKQGDIFKLPYPDDSFDTVFSHGVIEHFSEAEVADLIKEGLRVANTYVLSLPTGLNFANDLRGDENNWNYFRWRRAMAGAGFPVRRIYGMYSRRPVREFFNKLFGAHLTWVAPNLVFVVSRKQ